MAENTIILPQVEELLESQGTEKLIVEIDGELKRLGINLLNINTDEVVPIERGGTGANNGATGLANLFAAGPTLLSANQYGAEFPEDTVANTMFFKEATGTIADIGQDVAKALRAVNLLDNSDFTNPVNQRGIIESSNTGYFIDRWSNYSNNIKCSVTDNGLMLQTNAVSNYSLFYQKLPEGTMTPGTVYTMAVCFSDGSVHVGSAAFPTLEEGYKGVYDSSDIGLSFGYYTGQNQFKISIGPSKTITLKWAALYEGEYTAETLPPYVPKGYGAELAECKRYYQVIPYTIVKRTNNYDETYYFDAMRATPTATIYSMNAVVDKASYYTGNWADMDVIIMVWNEPFGGSIRLYASEPSNCNFGFAKITLSADV